MEKFTDISMTDLTPNRIEGYNPTMTIPSHFDAALKLADPSWLPHLRKGLEAVALANPDYLPQLASDDYLPNGDRLFAAFKQPLDRVRYVLVGEGPYPRAESATGVCFMDGAVGELWCDTGLSKAVNRATSLRNFMKLLLVADGKLKAGDTGGAAMVPVAEAAGFDGTIQTLAELQDNLTDRGFLLLNASLVFRTTVKPAADARGWLPFLQTVLAAMAGNAPKLILWGKIAEQIQSLPEAAALPQECSEHPYNLSFIDHAGMQALFGPMNLLKSAAPVPATRPRRGVQGSLI
jgi:uracil-DNA glycosylase